MQQHYRYVKSFQYWQLMTCSHNGRAVVKFVRK